MSASRGTKTEAVVLSRLLSAGYIVSPVFGADAAYDMVVDDGNKLGRVQSKTGHLTNNRAVVEFNSSSLVRENGKRTKSKSYLGRADIFAVYVPETDQMFMVPVEDVSSGKGWLRLQPPKNNQRKKIRLAADYAL